MKKRYIILIILASVVFLAMVALVAFKVTSPMAMLFGGEPDARAEIGIESYRLCKDQYGDDVIIIKYRFKNNREEPTALFYEGDFYVYQNGISLSECTDELPREYDYDPNDQHRNIKHGIEYYAEIAYYLEYPDKDVEVEVLPYPYGLFPDENNKIVKVFEIKV